MKLYDSDYQLPRLAKHIRSQCPGCTDHNLTVIYQEAYASDGIQSYLKRQYQGKASHTADDWEYALAKCNNCQLVFQKNVPSESFLKEIYDLWVPHTDIEHENHQLQEYEYLSSQIQFLIRHFRLPPRQLRMLDFGCGWCPWTKMAMGYGCNVVGVEVSESRINYAKSIGVEVLDLEALPPKSFQFINTEQVFEHLVDPQLILKQLTACLTSDGLIKISVPDSRPALEKLRKVEDFSLLSPNLQMSVAPLEHINSFTHDSLVAMAASVGLQTVRPRLGHLYNSASGLFSPKELVRTLVRPFYRHVYPCSTFIYFGLAQ